MIGLSPVNAAPVNDAGVPAVWHVAAAAASATASSAPVQSVRGRVGVSRAMVAVSTAAAMRAERFASAAALAGARIRVTWFRGRLGKAVAEAHAFGRQAQASAFRRFSAAAMAVARTGPAIALVNASYLVIRSRVLATASGVARMNVRRIVRSAYITASAFAVPGFVAIRTARSRIVAVAAGEAWAVRTTKAMAHAAAVASASAVHADRVRVSSASAAVTAQVRYEPGGEHPPGWRVIRSARAVARATAAVLRAGGAYVRIAGSSVLTTATALLADMVTWMYVHEPHYRTVFVRNDASTTRMQVFRKQPAEVLPYDVELAEWLEPLVGDDVESAQVSVTGAVNGDPADLIIDRVVLLAKDIYGQQDIQASRIKVWLSGGEHGATYKITVRADTEGGRRKEIDFRLQVREV